VHDELIKIDKDVLKKHRLVSGILLILLGAYLIWNNIIDSLAGYMSDAAYNAINDVTRVAPQIIIGVAIIVVGAKLIIGKKKECDIND